MRIFFLFSVVDMVKRLYRNAGLGDTGSAATNNFHLLVVAVAAGVTSIWEHHQYAHGSLTGF
jgi:hypothetical protein